VDVWSIIIASYGSSRKTTLAYSTHHWFPDSYSRRLRRMYRNQITRREIHKHLTPSPNSFSILLFYIILSWSPWSTGLVLQSKYERDKSRALWGTGRSIWTEYLNANDNQLEAPQSSHTIKSVPHARSNSSLPRCWRSMRCFLFIACLTWLSGFIFSMLPSAKKKKKTCPDSHKRIPSTFNLWYNLDD
jgi:hypothetical protein